MKENEDVENKKEPFELSFKLGKGNYIKDVFYETETDHAILIFKTKDRRLFKWIPKSIIKFGWKKDKENPQNIFFVDYFFPKDFYWELKKTISYLRYLKS